MAIRISPSILSADFANLEEELSSISHADLIHVDVMDGHFVPNLTIGLPVVKRLSEVSKVPLDVHLMIDAPEKWAGDYAKFAESVTFHFEATDDPNAVIDAIRTSGAKVAMSIKPATPLSAITGILPKLEMLLVMTVEPGFGGQDLIEATVPKIEQAREYASSHGLTLAIQTDGGVTSENISRLAKAGADTFVAGTAIFGASDRNAEIDRLRTLAITI
jgi:ribulose-phosphate 3-epimerase